MFLEYRAKPAWLACVKLFSGILALACLASCASQPEPLVVKTFQVRNEVRDSGDNPMVRMEKQRRLYGAVSMEERRQRLGQYYTVVWNDAAGVGSGPVEVVFLYQQGASGSRVKRMTKAFPASDAAGVADFAVIGDHYFNGGRVLTWKVTVSRGKKVLASRQSYLWQ